MVRFLLSGGVVYLIDIVTFFALSWLTQELFWSNVVAKSAGAVSGFFLHKYFTFSNHQRIDVRQVISYATLFCVNTLLASYLLLFLSQYVVLLIAKFVSDVVIIVFSFVVSKHIVFKTPKSET